MSTNNLPENMKQILEDFSYLETKNEKYEELLQYGDELEEMPKEYVTKKHLVPGCTSIVYIAAVVNEGKVQFYGQADAFLVKGLVAILIKGFNGMDAQKFLAVTPDFLTQLGLTETLSATRANASVNIFNMMQREVQKQQ